MVQRGGVNVRGAIFVALAACGWGTWALFLRGHGLPAAWQSTMILLVIAVAALPSALRGWRRGHGAAAWALLGGAALSDAGNYLCYFAALDRGPISVAVLTHYLAPLVVAALAPLVLRERLTLRTCIALGVSLGGLLLLVEGDGGLPRADLYAAGFGALSALCYGANTLITKKLFEEPAPGQPGFTAAQVLSFHCFGAAALVVASAPWPPPHLRDFVVSPLCGAVLVGAGGAALFYAGLRLIPAQRAAVLTYLEPLVASAVGAVFFAERLGAAQLAGGALILAGGAAVALAR